ncbi:hypothetical protein IAR50_002561 [Cryptococcus sp. DSM 104548]
MNYPPPQAPGQHYIPLPIAHPVLARPIVYEEGSMYGSMSSGEYEAYKRRHANYRDWRQEVPVKTIRPEVGSGTGSSQSFGKQVGVGSADWTWRGENESDTGTVPTTVVHRLRKQRDDALESMGIKENEPFPQPASPPPQAVRQPNFERYIPTAPIERPLQPPHHPELAQAPPQRPRPPTRQVSFRQELSPIIAHPAPAPAPVSSRSFLGPSGTSRKTADLAAGTGLTPSPTASATHAEREAYIRSATDLPLEMLTETEKGALPKRPSPVSTLKATNDHPRSLASQARSGREGNAVVGLSKKGSSRSTGSAGVKREQERTLRSAGARLERSVTDKVRSSGSRPSINDLQKDLKSLGSAASRLERAATDGAKAQSSLSQAERHHQRSDLSDFPGGAAPLNHIIPSEGTIHEPARHPVLSSKPSSYAIAPSLPNESVKVTKSRKTTLLQPPGCLQDLQVPVSAKTAAGSSAPPSKSSTQGTKGQSIRTNLPPSTVPLAPSSRQPTAASAPRTEDLAAPTFITPSQVPLSPSKKMSAPTHRQQMPLPRPALTPRTSYDAMGAAYQNGRRAESLVARFDKGLASPENGIKVTGTPRSSQIDILNEPPPDRPAAVQPTHQPSRHSVKSGKTLTPAPSQTLRAGSHSSLLLPVVPEGTIAEPRRPTPSLQRSHSPSRQSSSRQAPSQQPTTQQPPSHGPSIAASHRPSQTFQAPKKAASHATLRPRETHDFDYHPQPAVYKPWDQHLPTDRAPVIAERYLDVPSPSSYTSGHENGVEFLPSGAPSSSLKSHEEQVAIEVPPGSRRRLRVTLKWLRDSHGSRRNSGLEKVHESPRMGRPPAVPPKEGLFRQSSRTSHRQNGQPLHDTSSLNGSPLPAQHNIYPSHRPRHDQPPVDVDHPHQSGIHSSLPARPRDNHYRDPPNNTSFNNPNDPYQSGVTQMPGYNPAQAQQPYNMQRPFTFNQSQGAWNHRAAQGGDGMETEGDVNPDRQSIDPSDDGSPRMGNTGIPYVMDRMPYSQPQQAQEGIRREQQGIRPQRSGFFSLFRRNSAPRVQGVLREGWDDDGNSINRWKRNVPIGRAPTAAPLPRPTIAPSYAPRVFDRPRMPTRWPSYRVPNPPWWSWMAGNAAVGNRYASPGRPGEGRRLASPAPPPDFQLGRHEPYHPVLQAQPRSQHPNYQHQLPAYHQPGMETKDQRAYPSPRAQDEARLREKERRRVERDARKREKDEKRYHKQMRRNKREKRGSASKEVNPGGSNTGVEGRGRTGPMVGEWVSKVEQSDDKIKQPHRSGPITDYIPWRNNGRSPNDGSAGRLVRKLSIPRKVEEVLGVKKSKTKNGSGSGGAMEMLKKGLSLRKKSEEKLNGKTGVQERGKK